MIGQLIEAAQIAQHDFERHVLTDLHHVEIHQRADSAFGIGHRFAQLLALFGRQQPEHILDNFARQIGRKVGDFVGIELPRGGDQFMVVHVLDKRLAHCIGDFEQNFAVATGLDQIPHHQALRERQGFKDVGNVRGMQRIQQCPQFLQNTLALRGRFRRGIRLALRIAGISPRLDKRIMPVEQAGYAFKRVVDVGTGVAVGFHSQATRHHPLMEPRELRPILWLCGCFV